MRSFVFSVVLALLRPAASLDLVVKESMVCDDDLPISLNFTSMGDYANTLSFGRDDPVQGEFVYTNLTGMFDVNEASTMSIDARVSFGYDAFDLILEEGNEAPLCWDDYADEGCPQDGEYIFDGNYTMPSAPSDFLGWAASGYSGKVVVTIKVLDQLAGECTMAIETKRSGDFDAEERDFSDVKNLKLTGRETAMIVFGSLAASIIFWIFLKLCCCRGDKKRAAKEPLIVTPSKQALITPVDHDEKGDAGAMA